MKNLLVSTSWFQTVKLNYIYATMGVVNSVTTYGMLIVITYGVEQLENAKRKGRNISITTPAPRLFCHTKPLGCGVIKVTQ